MREILKNGLARLGLPSGKDIIDKFERYYQLLIDYNQKVNLTAITEPHEVAVKHFLDSVSLLDVLEIPYGARVIDVGTGAGFPGLPLKIVRGDIRLTLLDSLKKRVVFLEMCAGELGLEDVSCIHGRAEEFGKQEGYRQQYDLAVSRAVANLATLCEYCFPFVRVGGKFAALKGPAAQQEAADAKNAMETLGGGNPCINLAHIADADLAHSIVLVDKIVPTPPKYPRSGNKPLNKPL